MSKLNFPATHTQQTHICVSKCVWDISVTNISHAVHNRIRYETILNQLNLHTSCYTGLSTHALYNSFINTVLPYYFCKFVKNRLKNYFFRKVVFICLEFHLDNFIIVRQSHILQIVISLNINNVSHFNSIVSMIMTLII